MVLVLPGWLASANTTTPGSLPCRAFTTLDTCFRSSSLLETLVAEPVNALFFALPKATTITWSISSSPGRISMGISVCAPTTTSWVSMPV